MLHVVFCIAYSIVNYFNISLSRLITSVGEERAVFSAINYFYFLFLFEGVIIIIITTLFQEDNIFGRVASLTYGPQLTNVGMIL